MILIKKRVCPAIACFFLSATAVCPPVWSGDAAAEKPDMAKNLARFIDQQLEKRQQLELEGVKPANIADDATFLRRVSLDIAGRIPTISEVRDFLDDESPKKREVAVNRLLTSSGYSNHFARLFQKAFLPEQNDQFRFNAAYPSFFVWLRGHVEKNTPYDKLAYEMLTASTDSEEFNQFDFQDGPVTTASAQAFFVTREVDPARVATATARSLLGVRLDCAQCHDDPFNAWEQEQFWGFAAFFDDLDINIPNRPPVENAVVKGSIKIPETSITVRARFLNEPKAAEPEQGTYRQHLAEWVTSPENPYFAKMAVNRIWAHFFGYGLVEPLDDFSESNSPSHPEILDRLAAAFVESNFDLQFLIRTMTATKAYQRSSRLDSLQEIPVDLFAKTAVRQLSAEQMWASLGRAIGYARPLAFHEANAMQNGDVAEFLQSFQKASSLEDAEATILQALRLMNGDVTNRSSSATGEDGAVGGNQQTAMAVNPVFEPLVLTSLATFPGMDNKDRIEALFLATLSRTPTKAESKKLTKYIGETGDKTEQAQRLGDVLWALLNSAEFRFNH